MSRERNVHPDHDAHLGDGAARRIGGYTPKFTHEELDALVGGLIVPDTGNVADQLYVPFDQTFDPAPVFGATYVTVPYVNSLVNHIRIDVTPFVEGGDRHDCGAVNLWLIGNPAGGFFSSVFAAEGVVGSMEREGGGLFYFNDFTGSGLTVAITNVGEVEATVRLRLNARALL